MSFPCPMNILVDTATGHECFSFMDGYSGYNKIFMELVDAQKTAFRMPFDASSTSQGGGIRSSANVTGEKHMFTYKS